MSRPEKINTILDRVATQVFNTYDLTQLAKKLEQGTVSSEELMRVFDETGRRMEEARERERNRPKDIY